MTPLLPVTGAAGAIEVLVDLPAAAPRGIVLIAHPHPLGGGTNSNKVVHTLAKTFTALGYVALRPNFRGVGASAGVHDEGRGEADDLVAVLAAAQAQWGAGLPVVLAGYSFGAYVQTRLARLLAEAGSPAERLLLIGTAAGYIDGHRQYDTAAVPADTVVIHGAADQIVPLANVLAWAEPLDLPVIVLPATDHFFHRKLALVKDIVTRAWH